MGLCENKLKFLWNIYTKNINTNERQAQLSNHKA